MTKDHGTAQLCAGTASACTAHSTANNNTLIQALILAAAFPAVMQYSLCMLYVLHVDECQCIMSNTVRCKGILPSLSLLTAIN